MVKILSAYPIAHTAATVLVQREMDFGSLGVM
jgi:hypothetical protein